MRMMHWLEQRASLTPNRMAVRTERETLTFAELRLRSRLAALRLAEQGVERGSMVAVFCHNSVYVPIIIHAIHYLGAVAVPLNTRLTAAELRYPLCDAECMLLIHDEPLRAVAVDAVRTVDHIRLVTVTDIAGQPSDGMNVRAVGDDSVVDAHRATSISSYIHSDDMHSIMYTSGTTGRPKGVMLTFHNYWASAIGSVINLGLHEGDHWLAAVPLFHMSGMSILVRSVIYGMTVTIHESFDPRAVNRAICEQGVTIVSVVSAMLARMIEAMDDRGAGGDGDGGDGDGRIVRDNSAIDGQVPQSAYPPHFRCMLLGGGPAPLSLLEKCRSHNIPVYQTYGMTETAAQIVTLPPEYALSKLGSAGKPLFQAEVRIIGESGGNTANGSEDGGSTANSDSYASHNEPLPPGQCGEIAVRGPSVANGYWQRDGEAPLPTLDEDGWFRTGDFGYMDEEGFLYVLDRRQDLIISGGENIAPAEIESVLLSHPDIIDAGVTGIPNDKWGQVPVAFVVLRAGATCNESELLAYCADKLAKYKRPTNIYRAESLPRNAANKLLRRELLNLLPKTK